MKFTMQEWKEICKTKSLDEVAQILSDNLELNEVWDDESLKQYAKDMIDEDKIFLAIHVLEAVQDGFEGCCYKWDCTMGTMQDILVVHDNKDFYDFFVAYCCDYDFDAQPEFDVQCPLDGDVTNDCADCVYSADFHFDPETGECVRRKEKEGGD